MTEKQRRLIEKKLNYLKERLILETDGSVQFKLQEEIAELEQQLAGAADSRQMLGERPTAKPNNWMKWLSIIVATTAFFASVAECTGYSLRELLETEEKAQPTKAEQNESTATIDTLPPETSKEVESKPKAPSNLPKVNEETSPKPEPKQQPQASKETPLKISGDTNLGRENLQLKEGESLELYYTVTRPCKVRIIYQLADTSLILLHNDLELTEKDINQRKLLDIFEVYAPLGKEQIFFFAQTADFPTLVTHTEDGYEYIDEGLPEALEKTRGLKQKVFFAEDKLDILTMPKD